MKKITTKINFLKPGVLLFGVSLLLWNCEKGEFSNEEVVLPQYRSPIESMEIVSLSDINPTIKNTVINSESHFVRKSQKYISYSLNDIIKIVDTLQNTKFSIRFKLNNQPENVIYNLIIGIRNDNSTIVPYVMKYTINNLSEMTNNDGSLDFLKFKGTVGKYGYTDILKSLGKKHKSNNSTKPEPICPKATFGGSSGYNGRDNEGINSNTNYGGNRNSASHHRGGANSHFPNYTFSSNNGGSKITGFTVGDGTITTDDGKKVNCNDLPVCPEISVQGTSSGGEVQRAPDPNDPQPTEVKDIDCEKDGEVPINPPPGCVGKDCPCPGDPVNNPEIAPSGGWNTNGGRYGLTRNNGTKFHKGLDIKSPEGSNLYSMEGGKVVDRTPASQITPPRTRGAGDFGNTIEIETTLANGNIIRIKYAHLNTITVAYGTTIEQGAIIGTTGKTGNARDKKIIPHVHIGVRKKVNGKWKHQNPENYLSTKFNADGSVNTSVNPCN